MTEVTIHEAKTHLSRLLREVASGTSVTITRGRKPVARLVPIEVDRPREMGFDRDLVWIAPDFDAPLPDELLRAFEA